MRKVHLISVTEPLLFDLALAIHQKGYEVSVSGVGLTDTTLARLEKEGCTCHGDGWFPERLTKDIHFVVLGAAVRQDNPELIRGRERGKDLFADSLRGLSRLYSGSLFPDQPECCPPGLPPVRCKRCGFLSGIIRI